MHTHTHTHTHTHAKNVTFNAEDKNEEDNINCIKTTFLKIVDYDN